MYLTISKLAKEFGLCRSTLLYYDKIGLLCPENHEKGEYRIYSEDDKVRLEAIVSYRKAGIPLADIQKILTADGGDFTSILEARFETLNREIQKLYDQQKVIAGLLKNHALIKGSKVMNKALWTKLLETAGFTDEDMKNWHISFEKTDPEMHLVFLQQLQISEEEISAIRNFR